MLNIKQIRKLGRFIRSQVNVWIKGNLDIGEEDLSGACAIASYTMYRCLIKLGYKPKLIMADSMMGCHCWVELNNFIIDLTATQFNFYLPKVFICKKEFYKNRVPKLKQYRIRYNNSGAVRYIKTWNQQSPLIYFSEIKNLVKNLDEKQFKTI